MCADFPRELPLESLDKLLKVYLAEWPKHIVIHSTLLTFVQRFKEFPELKKRFQVFALSDEWETDGCFLARVSGGEWKRFLSNSRELFQFECNEIETVFFFDTLSDAPPGKALRDVFDSLDYSNLVTIFSVRNLPFRQFASDLIREKNLKIADDTNTVCYSLSKCDAKNLDMT